MKIVVVDSTRLHFEDRALARNVWLIGGVLFLPGLLALGLVPEAHRLVGLLAWMVVWTGLLFTLPRWLGDRIQVSLDAARREIVWARNGRTTRSVPFAEVKDFEMAPLATAVRPYKTFQLFVTLKNGSRITLAVDPREAEIRRALALARARLP